MSTPPTSLATAADAPPTNKPAAQLAEWVAQHWLALAGVAVVGIALGLWAWQSRLQPGAHAGSTECPVQALLVWKPASCEQALNQMTQAISAADRFADPDRLWEAPTAPRLFLWVDNFFIDLYTLFFIGVCLRNHVRLHLGDEPHGMRRQDVLLVVSVGCCLAGALVDHAENFWLLAYRNEATPLDDDLTLVAMFTAWKFRLFAINAVACALWAVAGLRAGRTVP